MDESIVSIRGARTTPRTMIQRRSPYSTISRRISTAAILWHRFKRQIGLATEAVAGRRLGLSTELYRRCIARGMARGFSDMEIPDQRIVTMRPDVLADGIVKDGNYRLPNGLIAGASLVIYMVRGEGWFRSSNL